ncbi:MAG: hypothetical protein KJO33_13550, partial [Gammaproteobacteria bacterium]|nr:hypothetical protein [Gammaproteobacteria bacterium]
MKTMTFAAWLAAVLLVIAGPVSAEKSCPAVPKGPGLVAADLIDDEGDTIGSFKAYNTTELMIFELYFDGVEPTDIQLYIAENMDRIPAKKGKPNFGKFPWQKKHFEFDGDKWELLLNLDEDLDFKWQGRSHFWTFMLHGDYLLGDDVERGFWAHGPCLWDELEKYTWFPTHMYHPDYGHFIDSPVFGLGYEGPTQKGVTGYSEDGEPIEKGGFRFFPDEEIHFAIDNTHLGIAPAAKKVSPLDLFSGADINDHRVISVARTLQTLDEDSGAFQRDGKIVIRPEVAACYSAIAGPSVDWADVLLVDDLLVETVANCNGGGAEGDVELAVVGPDDAQGNLEAGLNASGIFRKNISKTEDWGESKQKLEVMPVYFPGMRSNDDPSLCIDVDGDKIYDETDGDMIGVPYEEWRLSGDPAGEECDPRDYVDPNVCVLTLIECRDVAKPLLVSYVGKIDIYDDQVTTDFWPHRFSNDVYTAVSRDDGTTWKRMNLSRHADQSSIELETGEPFPGTASSPYLKVNDNKILVAWQSKFCDKGNPRYAINTCDDPATPEIEVDDPLTEEFECAIYCRGNPDQGTEVCEPDYPYDDDYYVTDIWGVRGHQRTVDYDEVDDVADLGIGEIPYSCLWVARGVIVTQKELDAGTFDSLNVADDPATEEDETKIVELGNIVWFKPERITSGRRDVYIPVVGSARGAGFAIAWQADPSGLRPGKGKGPGEGWSGAISNHKTDIWYTFISYGDFNLVDEGFVPAGPGDDATDDGGYLDKPGLGRPKALVPFTLPVRVTDNDMINTHTLKVAASSDCVIPPDGTNEACFPEVVDGSFTPILEDDISSLFCGHPDANPATCCDPNNHEGDPNCEDLKGFFGNLNGTKRYAYMARSIDEVDNTTGHYLPGGDGIPDYQYYVDRGGTLDLCDLSGANSYMDILPGTSVHERWYGFTNAAGASKLVCVSSDGRMIDGDVSASRPMLQLQPYTRPDGTKSAWALLSYEESKGMGHSLAAEAHDDTDNPVDDIIGDSGEGGQDKPFKQDIGKNLIYHSFDFTQPDLVSAGHMVNLPALCGGLYPTYCDDPKTPDIIEEDPDNPACTCTAGQPVPLYFDYPVDTDGDGIDDDWLPDADKFLQYRTEIARRARFIMQSPGKMGASKTLGAIIYKQGQEGQGRPADVFIRRMVKSGTGNPYKFGNFECTTWLDETFDLPGCPTDGVSGYNCNVWGEASGDRLCGGTFTDPNGGYLRRDHINLTSADIDMAVDAGPVDDTPDDPTDDRYGTNKVLLWSQHERTLGDESYGLVHDDGTPCD